MIEIIAVTGIPIVKTEKELWDSLYSSLQSLIKNNDIIVSAHTIWSRVRGPIFKISEMTPSQKAKEIANELGKQPEKIEIILQSSDEIVKIGRNVIITKNKAGVICANAGIDESNAGIGFAVGVPDDPDALAKDIREFVRIKLDKGIAVIISDTVGRALRKGAVNIAIGVSGISPMRSEIGKMDLFGYEMRVSELAVADEISAAAELIQGQTNEAIPFVIVRGYKYQKGEQSARVLNRPYDERLFR